MKKRKKVHRGIGINVLIYGRLFRLYFPRKQKNGRRHMASVRLGIYGTIGRGVGVATGGSEGMGVAVGASAGVGIAVGIDVTI